jgi:predicted lysophospholipase L1 biosynthesis ABC-type transport system permease subunit
VTMWIGRLGFRTLRADGRWLFPILLCACLALAALVPVEALHQAGEAEFGRYGVDALGADMRIEVSSVVSNLRQELDNLMRRAGEQGARVGRIFELVVPVRRADTEIPLRIVVVEHTSDEGGSGFERYPFYGGDLWSKKPEEALSEGLALSTNALRNLNASVGDEVSVGSHSLAVTAAFPESVLTLAASGTGGTAVVTTRNLPVSPDALGGREIVVIKYPADQEAAREIRQRIRETLGKSGVFEGGDVAPAIEVGLARLKQAFLWCGVLIVFMCAFGLAFGIEDYVNSKGDEIATLKVLGFSPGLVGLILFLRLALAGLVAGLLGVGFGWLLTAASARVVGSEAKSIAQLIKPSVMPWSFLLVGPALILAFGAAPLLVRLLEKPHHVLWSKMRGFPLAVRTGTGIVSLLWTLGISVPVTLGLARWYCGPGQIPALGTTAVLITGTLVLALVALVTWCLSTAGRRLSIRLRWAFTYLSMGRGRLVAAAGAIAFALAIASTTVLLDRVITWEVQVAVRKQVPFSVCAVIPHGALSLEEEEDISRQLTSLQGVMGSAYCDVGWAHLPGGQSVLVKALRLDEAEAFGSTLKELASNATPGLIPCTIWEEKTKSTAIGEHLTITVGTSPSSGPQGKSLETVVVGLDPRPGLRVGLNAPLTVPAGVLDTPAYRFLGVQVDPAYTFYVADTLRERLPIEVEVHDFGPIEVMLRSAAEELSFVWRSVAFFALLVSIVTYLTTSSVSRLMRSYEIALLRVLGVAGWRLRLGPLAEAVTQGLVSGAVGVLVAYLAVYRGLDLFINVGFPMRWELPVSVVAVSVLLSLSLQITALRANLGRSALETLRSE